MRSGYLKWIEPLIHRSTSTNKASDCTFLWPMLARSCRYSNLSMFSLFCSSPASKFQYETTNLHRSWNYCPWLPPTSCPGTFFNHQALEILKQAPLHPDISSLISLKSRNLVLKLEPFLWNKPHANLYIHADYNAHDFTLHPNNLLFLMWHPVLVAHSSEFCPQTKFHCSNSSLHRQFYHGCITCSLF